MVNKENVMKIAPVIMGVCNWSLLAALVAGVECMPENEVKNYVRAAVYGSFLGASVIGYLGRKKRANAKLYNDRVFTHDSDSGRAPHMGYIARVNVPNLLVNPWAVLAPIMADVVRLNMINGSLSCTPKTVKWLASTDGVRWNIDPIGCNEVVSGTAAAHLCGVVERLNTMSALTKQHQDMKDGIEKMQKNGLSINEKIDSPSVNPLEGIANAFADSAVTKEQVSRLENDIAEMNKVAENRKTAVTKFVMKKVLSDPKFIGQLSYAVRKNLEEAKQ